MRLVTYDSKFRPERAGEAKLVFGDFYEAKRQGDVITIPEGKNAVLLQDSTANLFLCLHEQRVYFGGTDEKPFLVRLHHDKWTFPDWERLWIEGKLLPYLKPQSLIKLEASLGMKGKSVRQGDIWALPIPDTTWEGIITIANLFGLEHEPEFKLSKDYKVYGTRHCLKGKYLETSTIKTGQKSRYQDEIRGIIAQGILKAPDHKSLDISKGLHVLFQNDLLAQPREAD